VNFQQHVSDGRKAELTGWTPPRPHAADRVRPAGCELELIETRAPHRVADILFRRGLPAGTLSASVRIDFTHDNVQPSLLSTRQTPVEVIAAAPLHTRIGVQTS